MSKIQGRLMYDTVDRSAIKALTRRGLSANKIAELMGMDRKTVLKILKCPTEAAPQTRQRSSAVDPFRERIQEWLARETPIKRMLELAFEGDPPYQGRRSEFYSQVKRIREELARAGQEVFVRFGSLPGEYCQVDWGERRDFPFTQQAKETRYFFCARLKFSRVSYVCFTPNTRLETLLRCLLQAFEFFGGVPWVCVFDNMKTVTTGRDEHHKPIWNPTFLKMMVEVESHPLACWPASGWQKGAVENLVGWVQSNFFPERTFLDDDDLNTQRQRWLDRVNNEVSAAHDAIPFEVLRQTERAKLIPLRTTASDYGLAEEVKAGNESLVHIDSNRYSVPVGYVNVPLLARVRRNWIEFYDEDKMVARHARAKEKQTLPIRVPEHYEPVFKKKPRAQVMLYRDHLMGLDVSIKAYIETVCFRSRTSFGPAILQMYALWKTHGTEALGAAAAVASEHGCYGTDYLSDLLKAPRPRLASQSLDLPTQPPQTEIERPLSEYEAYVHESGGR